MTLLVILYGTPCFIRIENFADSKIPECDAVIGNVPFADVRLDYRGQKLALHDYFLAKSVDALKPGGENPLAKAKGDLFHIRTTIELKEAEEVKLEIRGLPLMYRAKEEKLSFGDKSATVKLTNGRIALEVLVDRTSVEIFANKGRVYMPMPAAFKGEGLSLSAAGGEAFVHTIDVNELKSIWKQ